MEIVVAVRLQVLGADGMAGAAAPRAPPWSPSRVIGLSWAPDRELLAVVIRSATKAFSAGADVGEHHPEKAAAMIQGEMKPALAPVEAPRLAHAWQSEHPLLEAPVAMA